MIYYIRVNTRQPQNDPRNWFRSVGSYFEHEHYLQKHLFERVGLFFLRIYSFH